MDIPSLPAALRDIVPNRQTPWQFSQEVKTRLQIGFANKLKVEPEAQHVKIQITPDVPEYRFVQACFDHSPPENRIISAIWCVYNPTRAGVFEGNLSTLRGVPQDLTWQNDADFYLRNPVFKRFERISALFSPFNISGDGAPIQNVTILPLWHGTRANRAEGVCNRGFTFYGLEREDLLNDGQALFGNGMYFTNSARYANLYSSDGNLLLGWVAISSSYPVISHERAVPPDQPRDIINLRGHGAVGAHNAHYIPVVSVNPPGAASLYYPCVREQVPEFDEFVVFQQEQALVRFWVKIDVAMIRNPALLVNAQAIQQLSEEILRRLQEGAVAVEALSLAVVGQLQEITRIVHTRVQQIPEIAFGTAKWLDYFGVEVEEPFLPINVHKILEDPHPFVAGQCIRDGFWLTLIPEGMTLKKLDELTLNAKKGRKIGFRNKGPDWYQFNEIPTGKSHWVLMSKKTIPRSERQEEKREVRQTYERQGYKMPYFVDAATCMLVDCVETGSQNNYLDKPRELISGYSSYTECLEVVQDMVRTILAIELFRYKRPLRVGGMTPGGLDIGVYPGDDFGFAAVKTFY